MAKIIKMSPADIESAVAEFRSTLTGSPMIVGGKFSYTKTFPKNDRKATIHFTEIAHLKMTQLVEKFNKEIAWHGVAYRDEDPNKDDYYITDILVYPQEVTGATVTTDQSKYQTWLYSHEDEVFNNIRFQGHSHVNMDVNPSSTDNALYDSLIGMMGENDFYIFGIWNKKDARNIAIYDMKKNMVFDNSEISVDVLDNGTGIAKFLKEAASMVTERQYGNPYQGATGYQYGNYGYGRQVGYPSNTPAVTTPSKPTTPVTPAAAPQTASGDKKKKKKIDTKAARIALYGFRDDYEEDDDGYSDNPYSAFGHT